MPIINATSTQKGLYYVLRSNLSNDSNTFYQFLHIKHHSPISEPLKFAFSGFFFFFLIWIAFSLLISDKKKSSFSSPMGLKERPCLCNCHLTHHHPWGTNTVRAFQGEGQRVPGRHLGSSDPSWLQKVSICRRTLRPKLQHLFQVMWHQNFTDSVKMIQLPLICAEKRS